MVAAKKIHQSDTLRDIKDPDETIYLKKALEKSKKK